MKLPALALAVAVVVTLGGCSYDYSQRTDRVAFSAGNAVKTNLERETDDPSKASMQDVSGLGKQGVVTPQ